MTQGFLTLLNTIFLVFTAVMIALTTVQLMTPSWHYRQGRRYALQLLKQFKPLDISDAVYSVSRSFDNHALRSYDAFVNGAVCFNYVWPADAGLDHEIMNELVAIVVKRLRAVQPEAQYTVIDYMPGSEFFSTRLTIVAAEGASPSFIDGMRVVLTEAWKSE